MKSVRQILGMSEDELRRRFLDLQVEVAKANKRWAEANKGKRGMHPDLVHRAKDALKTAKAIRKDVLYSLNYQALERKLKENQ